MARKHSDDFKREAVRFALTSGLTSARRSMRNIDESGVYR